MLLKREEFDFDKLLDAAQTEPGILEVALGALCVLAGWYLARWVFRRFFTHHPELYERFLPYVGHRLVLPVSAQLLVQSCTLVLISLGKPVRMLHVMSALLFGLTMIRLCTAVLRQALPKGKVERHSEHFLTSVLWLGFVGWAIGFNVAVEDWLESMTFSIGKTKLDLLTILSGLMWVSIIVVAALWVSRVVEARLMSLKHMDLSLRIVFSKLTRTGLLVASVLIALPVVGIDLTVLSVFGGAVGIGLGFGLQKIASNFVSGFIILLDRSIRIGDRLTVDNRVGIVTKMTSRYVVLKGGDGVEALVPNDALISNTVINQSYSDKSIWISIPVAVAYGTDLEQALELLKAAGRHPRVPEDMAPSAFVTLFGDNGITLELGIWVKDPENGLLGLKSDINLAIWRAFKEHGISMPFPQRDIRIVSGHAG